MKAKNLVKLSFYSRSVNEGFARAAAAAFAQTGERWRPSWPRRTPPCPNWRTSRPPSAKQ